MASLRSLSVPLLCSGLDGSQAAGFPSEWRFVPCDGLVQGDIWMTGEAPWRPVAIACPPGAIHSGRCIAGLPPAIPTQLCFRPRPPPSAARRQRFLPAPVVLQLAAAHCGREPQRRAPAACEPALGAAARRRPATGGSGRIHAAADGRRKPDAERNAEGSVQPEPGRAICRQCGSLKARHAAPLRASGCLQHVTGTASPNTLSPVEDITTHCCNEMQDPVKEPKVAAAVGIL